MVKIFIDERELEVQEGQTILEAAESIDLHIPHLCYHEAFAPEGSCRMCLVEIEGIPKLELACSTRVREGMKVATKSERVMEARKGVLECLLAEHPIDCPICDKAGECKLQDYYEEYGLFKSTFKEHKEKREKKTDIGKNLILDRERCILCTRCVRFLREITKTEELGVFQRGIHSEISPYDGVLIDNNYAGNLVEICPVGALTDKDFRFKTRTWFLKSGDSICPLCSRGCSITVESHQGFSRFTLPKRVYRVRSRENAEINGLWICDRGRYGYTYLNEERLDRIVANDFYLVNTWADLIFRLAEKTKRLYGKMKASRIGVILHTWLSNEELFLVDKLFRKELGTNKIGFIDPPEGESDDFLMTSERTPNRRGAKELGFDLSPVKWGKFFEGIELLFVFASPFMDRSDMAPLEMFLEKTRTKILLAPHLHDFSSRFNVVAPVSLIAEKEGTLTNVNSVIQAFSPALDPPGDSRSEWDVLVDFAKQLKINYKFYSLLSSPDSIRKEMKKEIPFFEKYSE